MTDVEYQNVSCNIYRRREERKKLKKIKQVVKFAYSKRKRVEDVLIEAAKEEGRGRRSTDKLQSARMLRAGEGNSAKRTARKKKRRTNDSGYSTNNAKIDREEEFSTSERIERDDDEIQFYEKLLGYDKRKSKRIPGIFVTEGLDDLLDLCSTSKQKHDERPLKKKLLHGDVDIELVPSSKITRRQAPKHATIDCKTATDVVPTNSNSDDEGKSDVEEDIYGRVRCKRSGKLLQTSASDGSARVNLNELNQSDKLNLDIDESRETLTRNLRGIINRLNEQTIVSSLKTISTLFASYGHNDVKEVLFETIYKSVSLPYRLPDRILIEIVLLLALLHSTVSSDITTYFVERYVWRYLESIDTEPLDGNALENLSTVFAYLYNYRIIKAVMIMEISERLLANITERTLECFKVLLKYCGAVLKKRDCDVLVKCVHRCQSVLSTLVNSDDSVCQHIQFLAQEFLEIKDANIRHLTDTIDVSLFDHYIHIYRGLTRNVNRENELPMCVADILNAPELGRWWVVGSAWMPSDRVETDPAIRVNDDIDLEFDSSILNLAKRSRMNTLIRRKIFCTLVTSQDVQNAFEKLMRLSLKNQQEREIVHISIHCALQETEYNQFYAVLIDQFCRFHKRFKLTLQYALWDRIKELSDIESWKTRNLAMFLADCIIKRSIGVSVLKIIEYGSINRTTSHFLKMILKRVLMDLSDEAIREAFRTVVESPDLKLFSHGIHLFIQMTLNSRRNSDSNSQFYTRLQFLSSLWDGDEQ